MVVLDRKLVHEITEYLMLSRNETIAMLKLGTRLNALLWHTYHPETEKEIRIFYEITPFYIFDLAYWHMERYQRKFRDKVVEVAYGDTLDYGGGIGDLSVRLAEKGLSVTYGDMPGATLEFAKWLFIKRGYDIKIIDLGKEHPSNQYDTIICIDVIEHVTDPVDTLNRISGSLKDKGKLVITGLRGYVADTHPMHQKIEFDSEKLLESLGLRKIREDWLWEKITTVKLIHQVPAGGTKIG